MSNFSFFIFHFSSKIHLPTHQHCETEVPAPFTIKALRSNANQNYSLFTIHYSLNHRGEPR